MTTYERDTMVARLNMLQNEIYSAADKAGWQGRASRSDENKLRLHCVEALLSAAYDIVERALFEIGQVHPVDETGGAE